jgi:hypothetical protein
VPRADQFREHVHVLAQSLDKLGIGLCRFHHWALTATCAATPATGLTNYPVLRHLRPRPPQIGECHLLVPPRAARPATRVDLQAAPVRSPTRWSCHVPCHGLQRERLSSRVTPTPNASKPATNSLTSRPVHSNPKCKRLGNASFTVGRREIESDGW